MQVIYGSTTDKSGPGLSPNRHDAGWSVFRRDCVPCPSESPQCPASCPTGQGCSLVLQTCDKCAYMTCRDISSGATNGAANDNKESGNTSSDRSHSGGGGSSTVSSVAGGVVGGLAAIALVGFFVWYFVVRPRKKRALEDQRRRSAWTAASSEKSRHTTLQSRPGTHIFNQQQQQQQLRQSQMSGGARPLSQMTTTSNHIPIGFIDGVRGVPGSNIPVPPVPSAGATSGQDIYFPASDIYKRDTQDTAYFTTGAGRQSITPSLDGRSIASGVFQEDGRDNPMPSMPAMAVSLQRPQVVSVKNGSKPSSPTEMGTARPVLLPGSAGGDSSTSATSATAATFVRPTITTINRSNSKKIGRSDSTKSRSGSDAAQSPPTAPNDSPVIFSATAVQPWGTDLHREIANSPSAPASKAAGAPPDPFSDDHASS